jgi:general secretion pathway protein I
MPGKNCRTYRKDRTTGMTLIEVLVALLVLSVALMAAVRATGVTVENASSLKTRLCAEWVALNQLEMHRARADWLSLGKQKPAEISQGGVDFIYYAEVTGTPSPLARRIDIHVQLAKAPGHDVAMVTGYLMNQGRRTAEGAQ